MAEEDDNGVVDCLDRRGVIKAPGVCGVREECSSTDDGGDDSEDEAQSKSWSEEWPVVLTNPPVV